jgi:hypothetical protein
MVRTEFQFRSLWNCRNSFGIPNCGNFQNSREFEIFEGVETNSWQHLKTDAQRVGSESLSALQRTSAKMKMTMAQLRRRRLELDFK